jgi:hypothetical protein
MELTGISSLEKYNNVSIAKQIDQLNHIHRAEDLNCEEKSNHVYERGV